MSSPEELVDQFVSAYRSHVFRRISEQGLPTATGMEDAIVAGEGWLRSALTRLAAQPFASQTRGPLELFQEAMRFPTEALLAADVPPVERDMVETQALPGDHYRLAPASSRDLGEAAWRAHLAWGIAKAESMKGRR